MDNIRYAAPSWQHGAQPGHSYAVHVIFNVEKSVLKFLGYEAPHILLRLVSVYSNHNGLRILQMK